MRVGGNCLKYLKRGVEQKERRGNKDFKRGGQARSRGGYLKKWGLELACELCSHSYALLSLFPDTSIFGLLLMPFLPLGNSDHVVVSVSIVFSSNAK